MKQILLFSSCLTLSILSFAQVHPTDDPDHVKIIIGKDSVHISFKDKSFKINNIQDLDSWLKQNIAGMTPPDVDLVSYIELTPQKHRDIIIITDKYRCPVVSERTFLSGSGKAATFMKSSGFDH